MRRLERDEIRDLDIELIAVVGLGTADERIARIPLSLTREATKHRYRLTDEGLEEVAIPANER